MRFLLNLILYRQGSCVHPLLYLPAAVLSDMTQNNYTKVICFREDTAASGISIGL